MAFSDPQSITIDGSTISLPRVSTGAGTSSYRDASGLITLSASNTYGRRQRQVLRVDHSKVTSDPFIPTQNVKVSMSNYIVFDRPPAGYTNEEALDIWVGLQTLAGASSNAIITKLLGGES